MIPSAFAVEWQARGPDGISYTGWFRVFAIDAEQARELTLDKLVGDRWALERAAVRIVVLWRIVDGVLREAAP